MDKPPTGIPSIAMLQLNPPDIHILAALRNQVQIDLEQAEQYGWKRLSIAGRNCIAFLDKCEKLLDSEGNLPCPS